MRSLCSSHSASFFPLPRLTSLPPHFFLFPLLSHSRQISAVPSPGHLYSNLMDLIVRLARSGLIHGDFNEFNLLIRDHRTEDEKARDDETPDEREDRIEKEGGDFPVKVELEEEEWEERRRREREGTLLEPVLIDFPQMVSVDHADAE
jgi:RIO kinase 2